MKRDKAYAAVKQKKREHALKGPSSLSQEIA